MHMKKKKKILVLLCSALFLTSIFPSGKCAYGEEAGYEEDISSETEYRRSLSGILLLASGIQ